MAQAKRQGKQAFKKLCRPTCACLADAQQALISPLARYAKWGRPGQDAQPAQVVYQIHGALASSLAIREARLTQHSCFILATNALDEQLLSPQEVLTGYKGQGYTARGFRFLKDPQFLAASLYLKKPERIMALLMVMTVCLLVYAALEERIRKALVDHGETFPHQTGKPIQNPTARWVFHYFVGMHLLRMPGKGAMVLNLNDHRKVLRLLGKP